MQMEPGRLAGSPQWSPPLSVPLCFICEKLCPKFWGVLTQVSVVSLRPQPVSGSPVPGLPWIRSVGAQGGSAARWRYHAGACRAAWASRFGFRAPAQASCTPISDGAQGAALLNTQGQAPAVKPDPHVLTLVLFLPSIFLIIKELHCGKYRNIQKFTKKRMKSIHLQSDNPQPTYY